MIALDAEAVRASMMRNVLGNQPLYGLDEEYSFFYDETNNIRKFWITKNGLNETSKNFVLGETCHKKSRPLTELNELVKSLHIQKSATEIKFNQLATGDYLGVLHSKRIRTLLEWLIQNEVYIHYTNFNILYWSLVDIIDSLWEDHKLHQYIFYVMEIKNELFTLANQNLGCLIPLLRTYHFPNVRREVSFTFMNELADLFESQATHPQSDIFQLVIHLLRAGAELPEMPFLVDNEDDVLIDSFKPLFLRSLYTYPTSSHVFDNESEVQEGLANTQVSYKGKLVDYSFVKSHDSIEVQLSDGICGLLGSHFNFLEHHTFRELIHINESLNPVQKQTLSLLRRLIDLSDAQSNGFMLRIAPTDSDYKNDYFLHDRPLPMRLLT